MSPRRSDAPSIEAMALRVPKWPRMVRLYAACALIAIIVSGCFSEFGANAFVKLSSLEYVAGGQFDLVFEGSSDFVEVRPVGTGVVSAAYRVAPGRVRVAWASPNEIRGSILDLGFTQQPSSLRMDAVRVYKSGAPEPPYGAAALAFTIDASPSRVSAASQDDASFQPQNLGGNYTWQLDKSFANYPFGDVDQSGSVDVVDAMAASGSGAVSCTSAYAAYHCDLDGDNDADAADVQRLLNKVVNPDLPAELIVKPSYISFQAMTSGVPLLIGNAGNEGFLTRTFPAGSTVQAPPGVVVEAIVDAGIEYHSAAFNVTLPDTARKGWMPGIAEVHVDPSDVVTVPVGSLVVLVAGQSNASGRGNPVQEIPSRRSQIRMLGNDYVWKDAREPLDDITDQVDGVSMENPGRALYSFGTQLGHALWKDTGFYGYLIPAAKGGTSTNDWAPHRLDRSTLFGSAIYRAQYSGGLQPHPVTDMPAEAGPTTLIAWYQGESDSETDAQRDAYIANTNTIMNAFDAELDAPVVYAQLAAHSSEQQNVEYGTVAELQRQMESGYGSSSRSNFHMVVTNDLPLSEANHLSAAGQRVLAERIALSVRERILGETIDGTGPRLASITHSGKQVRVDFDRAVTDDQGDDYSGFFYVFDGAPQCCLDDVEKSNYYQNGMEIVDVRRDPVNASRILIDLRDTPSSTPYVRYMPPPGRSYASAAWDDVVENVVRSAESGLPLPTFGPLPPQTF